MVKTYTLSLTTAVLLLFVTSTACVPRDGGGVPARSVMRIVIEKDNLVTEVSERFLSVTLDASLIAGNWSTFRLHTERIVKMVAALSPGYLRFGGNRADTIVYVDKEDENADVKPLMFREVTKGSSEPAVFEEVGVTDGEGGGVEGVAITEPEYARRYPDEWFSHVVSPKFKLINITVILKPKDLDILTEFALKTNLKLIFDLNAQLRTPDGSWNCSNGQKIIDHILGNGHKQVDVHFQLGNEPNSYYHKFNKRVKAEQMVTDTAHLQYMLEYGARYRANYVGQGYSMAEKEYDNLRVIGPETTSHKGGIKYYVKYMGYLKRPIFADSFHHYYMNGRLAKLKDFLDYKMLNTFQKKVTKIKGANSSCNTMLWNTESGSTYGGGTHGLSNGYVAGFLWLDKLGVSAKNDIKVVARQSLYGGRYAMIDHENMPSPDYWLSLIYKRIVSPYVLDIKYLTADNNIRLYAHCSKFNTRFDRRKNQNSIVLFGMNLGEQDVTLKTPLIQEYEIIEKFMLEPLGGDLISKNVTLNGKLLEMGDERYFEMGGNVTETHGQFMYQGEKVILPARRFFFFVISAVHAPICFTP